jgi:periplasmic protein TonB
MGQARRTASWLVVLAIVTGGACFGQEVAKKISNAEAMSAATSKTQPDYPPVAKQFRVEGKVELEAVVGESGKVEKVNIVSGNSMLTHAAAEALKTWKFTPFTEDGKPVKALAPVSFTFKL